MKIKKEFIDLIYNGDKKYEFRNGDDKEGLYKIKDKYFFLDYLTCVCEINFSITNDSEGIKWVMY